MTGCGIWGPSVILLHSGNKPRGLEVNKAAYVRDVGFYTVAVIFVSPRPAYHHFSKQIEPKLCSLPSTCHMTI
eukprot:5303666-Pyramimonas_sp.AAC.1